VRKFGGKTSNFINRDEEAFESVGVTYHIIESVEAAISMIHEEAH
jgi:hypothetical protein